ncbi:DEAD/DEAH box helicase [bacterium SCN 62-11]|mgnify:CR=1 FL=1|nr:MAG: DEAD/DEAH box helicase [bacterium SCN 62-11]
MSAFSSQVPQVVDNPAVRIPQQETFQALQAHAQRPDRPREVGIVLPVGCGKSGCITLTPFAYSSRRTLVVAPGLKIASQLLADFEPSNPDMFYTKCNILTGDYPEPAEIRGSTVNRTDLDEADVVITNVHQLQGVENRWLRQLPSDYFDLILFDEGHHSVAATWELLKSSFPQAQIVNFSATPARADGQQMSGEVIYSFSVARAIQMGYVKHLKALVLNPRTLRYVRGQDGEEIEVSLEEVRRLGEQDSDFRRSIMTSQETLDTIVDASIRELYRIREANGGDTRHKIIAAALNYQHCHQIVRAYRSRNLRTDFVHSNEDSIVNETVLSKLKNHQLDVIVQVRKLSEGFDHPFLSVAAVFSVFSHLSPFIQFVGRIMRAIAQNQPGHPQNEGTVVFHAGANIAARWEDFQQYSSADQEYFQTLLPAEELEFGDASELTIDPDRVGVPRPPNTVEVRSQTDLNVQEILLLENDREAMRAIELLRSKGYDLGDIQRAWEHKPVPTSKLRRRQAARSELDARVKTEVGRILGSRNINPKGKELDRAKRKDNFVLLKSCLDRQVNSLVGIQPKQRKELSQEQLDRIGQDFAALSAAAEAEVFGGKG